MSKHDKLPPGLQLPIKASIIRKLIKDQNEAVEVSSFTWKHQTLWKKDRDLLTQRGQFNLLELDFRPDGVFSDDTPEVWVRLYGVPSELWKASGSAREQLVQILDIHLKAISEKRVWDAPWTIQVGWDTHNSKLEIHSHIAKGKREDEEIKQSIIVDKKI